MSERITSIPGAPIDEAPDLLTAALSTRPAAERLARRVRHPLLVIGRGYTYPIALEIALKVKELAGVWDQPGAAIRIMRRIKTQLDPKGILNPGRFVGGL